MAEAFECDRCGELESGTPVEKIPILEKRTWEEFEQPRFNGRNPKYEKRVSTKRMDGEFCSECAERLANFLDGGLGFPDP